MLANLSLVGCYNRSAMSQADHDRIILQSAKDNLRNMAFFGLTEFQTDTQFMFEQTFHLEFLEDFVQNNDTHSSAVDYSVDQHRQILQVNTLDVELYKYAKELFLQRLRKARQEGTVKLKTRSHGNKDLSPRQRQNKQSAKNVRYDYYENEESDYEEADDEEEEDFTRRRPGRGSRKMRHRG